MKKWTKRCSILLVVSGATMPAFGLDSGNPLYEEPVPECAEHIELPEQDACVVWRKLSTWLPPACVPPSDNNGEEQIPMRCPANRNGAQFYEYALSVPGEQRIPNSPSTTDKVQMEIDFPNNSFKISERYIGIIRNIYGIILANQGKDFEIVGHSNRTGDYNRNKVLSGNRARAVHDVIMENFRKDGRTPQNNITWLGKSWDEPRPEIADPADGRHRRTDVRLAKRQRGS